MDRHEIEYPGGIRQHLPNALTVLRLLLGIAFPVLPAGARLPVFIVAALTEFFDGFLARLWKVETGVGRTLDPIADKVFIFAVFATFVGAGKIGLLALGGVALRDIAVVVLWFYILLTGHTEEYGYLRPRTAGKIATNLQLLLLLSLFFVPDANRGLVGLTTVISGWAAFDYVLHYLRDVRVR